MRLAILTVALALLSTSTTLLAQTTPSIPPFDQVAEINLQTNAWYLRIRPDGSGEFGYGSSGGDVATAPKQSFSLKEVYNLLVPHLLTEGNIQNATAVALRIKGLSPGAPTYALYLHDKGIIKKIMSQAIDKSVPFEPKRFNELLTNHPPVPPDDAK